MLEEICKEENISYKYISDKYITILKKNNKIKYIYNDLYGLNSETSNLLCNDKYAMYEILKEYNIPVIKYNLIWHPGISKTTNNINKTIKYIKDFFIKYNNHIVLKPNFGNNGNLVFNINNINDIENIFINLLNKTDSIVINPFYNIKNEYRVIVLNGKVRLIYKKVLNNNWQFNLSKGSIASKEIDNKLKNKIIDIALKVNKFLKTKFVSIDIIDSNNNLYVLEVNGKVCTTKYLKQHMEDYDLVKNIYKDAIDELFRG